MSDIEIFDAFDDCIDRMNAGESLEDCLKDYPQHATRLRQLLETGELVYQAQYPRVEVSDEQAEVRERVVEAMQRKRKVEVFPKRRNWFIPLVAAAAMLFVVGLASVVFLAARPNTQEIAFAQTSSPLSFINETIAATATEGAIFAQTLAVEQTNAAGTQALGVLGTPTPAIIVGATSLPLDGTIIAGSLATSDPRTPIPEHIQQTATALSHLFAITPTPFAGDPSGGGGATRVPGELPDTGGGPSTEEIALTATALSNLLGIVTPTEIPIGDDGGLGGGDIGPVSTSVAVMSPIPATLAAIPTRDIFEVRTSSTPMPTGTAVAMLTLAPIMTATTTPTGTVTTTSTPTPFDNGFVPGTYTPVYDLSATPPPTQEPTQSGGGIVPPTPIQVIPLSAGEIDDNENWDIYLQYRNNYLQQYAYSVHDVDVTGRIIIVVNDTQAKPVLGANVQVLLGQTVVSQSQTYADGRTLFFPNANPISRNEQQFTVYINTGNGRWMFTLDRQQGAFWNVTIPAVQQTALKLDVVFLLDATGSMDDEIAELQNNLLAIAERIALLPGGVDVRYGLVTYRDRGDSYVTQVYDFMMDVGAFQRQLSGVVAGGGGDTPESLNQALHETLSNLSWRGSDTIKLVFLVADAAPHLDYPNDYDYAVEMQNAAARGIKIHPIASSGLTPDGEFIFRQIAQVTMGHFIFLTYDQSTPGTVGSERSDLSVGEPSNPQLQQEGEYTVSRLDELVLQLITNELAARSQTIVQNGIVIQAEAAFPLPASSTGAVYMTPTSTPLYSGSVSAISTPIAGGGVVNSQSVNLSLPTLLLLIVAGIFLGAWMVTPRNSSPDKRKNDAKKRIRVEVD